MQVKIGDKILKYRNAGEAHDGADLINPLTRIVAELVPSNHDAFESVTGKMYVGKSGGRAEWLVERAVQVAPIQKITAAQASVGRCPHCFSSRCNHNCQTFWSGKCK